MNFTKAQIKAATASAKALYSEKVKGSFKARKVADILASSESSDKTLLSKLMGAVLEESVNLTPSRTSIPAGTGIRTVEADPKEVIIILDNKYAYDVKKKEKVKHWLSVEHITGVANDGKKSRVFLTDDQIDNLKLS